MYAFDQNLGAGTVQSAEPAHERYAVLIDRKLQQSLTPAERLELESIAKLLDDAEKPFYEPIIRGFFNYQTAADNCIR